MASLSTTSGPTKLHQTSLLLPLSEETTFWHERRRSLGACHMVKLVIASVRVGVRRVKLQTKQNERAFGVRRFTCVSPNVWRSPQPQNATSEDWNGSRGRAVGVWPHGLVYVMMRWRMCQLLSSGWKRSEGVKPCSSAWVSWSAQLFCSRNL